MRELLSLVYGVQVPGELLVDRQMPASVKMLWMVMAHREDTTQPPLGQRKLALACDTTRSTVQRGLARLLDTGWAVRGQSGSWRTVVRPTPHPLPFVLVPAQLLRDRRLTAQARVFYARLLLLPGFTHRGGRATYQQLAKWAGHVPRTIRAIVDLLEKNRWLKVVPDRRGAQMRITLRRPDHLQLRRWERQWRRERGVTSLGEFISRLGVTIFSRTDAITPNARPEYLINVFTGEPLELDIHCYEDDVAFEFNGLQHNKTTTDYPDEEELLRQQTRDDIKEGILRRRGVQLVVLHPGDLTIDALYAHVAAVLPLDDLEGKESLLSYLHECCEFYQDMLAQAPWAQLDVRPRNGRRKARRPGNHRNRG